MTDLQELIEANRRWLAYIPGSVPMAFFSKVCMTLVLYQYFNYLLLVLLNSFWGILNFQGDLVWLPLPKVNDFDVPIGATVKSVDGLGMLLTDDEGQVCTIFSLEFQRMTSRVTKAAQAKVWMIYWTNDSKLKQCNKPISIQSTCAHKKSGNSVSVQRKCAGTGCHVTCTFVTRDRNIDL